MDIATLLTKYHPGRKWSLDGDEYGGLKFLDGKKKVSEKQLKKNYEKLKAERKLTEYKRSRKAEYPVTDDLIVAMWESLVEGDDSALNKVQKNRLAIKAKYPKGE